MRILLSILLCLIFVHDFSGVARLPLPHGNRLSARRVALFPDNPARRWIGALEYLDGIELIERGAATGGYSAIHVEGNQVTLLSDGGIVLRFRWNGGERVSDARYWPLPAGPGRGWGKVDRDSESLAVDPVGGHAWVGFERANAIWRYDADLNRAERRARPRVMADWEENGGPESLARMPDGGFVTISETMAPKSGIGRRAVRFARDPTATPNDHFSFVYRQPAGTMPTDAVALPDGRLLVLNRRFGLPVRFASTLSIVDAGTIRPGAVVTGRTIATLAAPALHDNFEGVTVTREGGRTIIWLVSDDNQFALQRTLLLKFRLAE